MNNFNINEGSIEVNSWRFFLLKKKIAIEFLFRMKEIGIIIIILIIIKKNKI